MFTLIGGCSLRKSVLHKPMRNPSVHSGFAVVYWNPMYQNSNLLFLKSVTNLYTYYISTM